MEFKCKNRITKIAKICSNHTIQILHIQLFQNPGLKAYKNMQVVATDHGLYLWLPVGYLLTAQIKDHLMKVFQKDPRIAWYCLHNVQIFMDMQAAELNRQLWQLGTHSANVRKVLARIIQGL